MIVWNPGNKISIIFWHLKRWKGSKYKFIFRGWPKEYRNPNNSFTNLTNKNLYNRIVDYNRENNQKYDQLNQRIY